VPACDSVANIEPVSAIEETDAVPVVPEHEQQSTGIEEVDITAPTETETNDSDAGDAKSTTKSTHSSDDVDSINHEFGDELFMITGDMNVEAFNNQKYTKRNKRDVMSNHLHIRSDSRRFREDRLIQLELPCHDNYHRGLHIPLPVEGHDASHDDGKPAKECTDCHAWYAMGDFHNHVKVCQAFFKYAVYCDSCSKIYYNNTTYKQQHIPLCNPYPVAQQPPDQTAPTHQEATSIVSQPSRSKTTCHHCGNGVQDLGLHLKECEFFLGKRANMQCWFCKIVPEGTRDDRKAHYQSCSKNPIRVRFSQSSLDNALSSHHRLSVNTPSFSPGRSDARHNTPTRGPRRPHPTLPLPVSSPSPHNLHHSTP
jgi:hypothetical protein